MFSKIFKPKPSERASVVGAQLVTHAVLHCSMAPLDGCSCGAAFLTISPSLVVECRVDLLRHPWTVGKGDPAEFDQLISQMDEMMVHDPAVATKLDAMVRQIYCQR